MNEDHIGIGCTVTSITYEGIGIVERLNSWHGEQYATVNWPIAGRVNVHINTLARHLYPTGGKVVCENTLNFS